MQAELDNWNDQRMDEFAARTDANFASVREEIKDVRVETNSRIDGLRADMNERFVAMESHFDACFASLDRRFDIMIGALVSGVIGLIVTHFIG